MDLIYRIYFWISSKKPFGAIDWWVRRSIGVIFNDATARADMQMIRQLGETRQAEVSVTDGLSDHHPVTHPDLDILIVFDSPIAYMRPLIDALARQTYPLKQMSLTILLSSEQADGELPDFLGVFSSLSYQKIDENHRSLSLNVALESSSAPFLLVLTRNLIPSETCIEQAVKACRRSRPTTCLWELYPTILERTQYCDPVTLGIPNSPMHFAIIRREALDALDGFDPRMPLEGQGLDLSYRLRSHGGSLITIGQKNHVTSVPDANEREVWRGKQQRLLTLLMMRRFYGGSILKTLSPFMYSVAIMCSNSPWSHKLTALKVARQHISLKSNQFRNNAHSSGASPSRLLRGEYEINFGPSRRSGKVPDHEKPLISIIIRTYAGRIAWLKESVRSALNQTYPKLEIIVVEDGTSESADYIESLSSSLAAEQSIVYLTQKKLGKSHSGNLALQAANGFLIGFLDDDDLLFPSHLEVLCSALDIDETAVGVYSLAWEAHSTTKSDHTYTEHYFDVPTHTRTPFIRSKLEQYNFLPIQSVLFRREAYEEHGGFDTQRHYLEDWELWLRYTRDKELLFVPKITSMYRTPADPYERILRVSHESRRSFN